MIKPRLLLPGDGEVAITMREATAATRWACCEALIEGTLRTAHEIARFQMDRYQDQHGEHGPTATRLAADLHLTRLALDHVEWCDRLVRLAELRKGGQ
jgi:hypothetical protein